MQKGEIMKFNAKVIFLGGLVYYIAQWVVSMVTGIAIHEGVLDPLYMSTTEFWRPELSQDPPDMAALMPRWITVGLIGAFIGAFIFDNVRAALDGSAVVKGFKFGFLCALFYASMCAGFSGFFYLPEAIWFWWGIDGFIVFLASGAVLGWITGKLSSD
jgi:hypothetical protein